MLLKKTDGFYVTYESRKLQNDSTDIFEILAWSKLAKSWALF